MVHFIYVGSVCGVVFVDSFEMVDACGSRSVGFVIMLVIEVIVSYLKILATIKYGIRVHSL